MNAPRIIPDAVLRVQIEASDPAASAWVAANAGSGKTHVLAQRVIRLLLDGVEPAKILGITFTKAAAANMANRVFKTLREWTSLDDAALDDAIRKVSDLVPDAARRARARRLFAVALESPGGLKVQTIHAFCTRVLHQFPFEANVAARFDVLDEAAESQLLSEVGLDVFLEAARQPDGALGRALAVATAEVADQTFKEVVGEAIRKRDIVRAWIDHGGSVDAAVADLCGTLGIAGDDTIEAIEKEMTEGPLLPASQWHVLAKALAQGSKNDQEQARRLAAAFAATGVERADLYLQVFFTGSLEPRQRLITKATEVGEPQLAECLVRRTHAAVDAGGAPQGRRLPRSHRGPHRHRRCRDLPLPGGKGPARPARLRRPHRQSPVPAPRGPRGLGALQARPGHRSRADRRGAGHEPEAMGDRPAADGRILCRRRRTCRQSNDLRRRRREAIDLLVPGCGAARVRGNAAAFPSRA